MKMTLNLGFCFVQSFFFVKSLGIIKPDKTTLATPLERLLPNPKLKLREQLREVMRFKHFSHRTEEAYWHWIKGFMVFCRGFLSRRRCHRPILERFGGGVGGTRP